MPVRYLLGVPVVNQPQLLRRAIDSIDALWPFTIVIDNGDEPLTGEWPVQVFRPDVPLSFSQTMNLLLRRARGHVCDVLFLMHSDAEAEPDTPQRLLAAAEAAIQANRRWGVIFTNYDALAAFNMRMVEEVGLWDTLLPQYFSDNDYYRRVELCGYELIFSELPVRHEASQTIRGDPVRKYLNDVTFPLYERYYRAKWGGSPGKERFDRPFGGALDRLRQEQET
jgi:hypothetical protein